MRKIFIDCGFYLGRAVNLFKKMPEYDPTFEIIAFDANKISDEILQNIENKGITFINKAVWTHDGEISFYASGRRFGQANSVYPNPLKPRREKKRTVECIDFSKWIKDNFSLDDYIILKMDIEGAEYPILKKMVEEGSIHYINMMFVEYHYERVEGVGREDFSKLKKEINEKTKIDIRSAIEW
jgi:FkbM family methyltransferase